MASSLVMAGRYQNLFRSFTSFTCDGATSVGSELRLPRLDSEAMLWSAWYRDPAGEGALAVISSLLFPLDCTMGLRGGRVLEVLEDWLK